MKIYTIILSLSFFVAGSATALSLPTVDDYYVCYKILYRKHYSENLNILKSSGNNVAYTLSVAGISIKTCNDLFVKNGAVDFAPAKDAMVRFYRELKNDVESIQREAAKEVSQ